MKPKVIEHLISIGFEEIIGEWRPVWGQGDGEYWLGKLVRDTDIVYTDRDTTFFKYSYNGIITNEEFLMTLKKETTIKTAVEWLIDKHFGGIENCTPDFRKHIEEAIEIEKQQMRSASCPFIGGWEEGEFEDWYNETFNK